MLYWLAQRRSSSRFIYNVPQRTEISENLARAELSSDLERTPPAVIVVEGGDAIPSVTGNALDSAASMQNFHELREFITQNYVLFDRVGNLQLFERRNLASEINHQGLQDTK